MAQRWSHQRGSTVADKLSVLFITTHVKLPESLNILGTTVNCTMVLLKWVISPVDPFSSDSFLDITIPSFSHLTSGTGGDVL